MSDQNPINSNQRLNDARRAMARHLLLAAQEQPDGKLLVPVTSFDTIPKSTQDETPLSREIALKNAARAGFMESDQSHTMTISKDGEPVQVEARQVRGNMLKGALGTSKLPTPEERQLARKILMNLEAVPSPADPGTPVHYVNNGSGRLKAQDIETAIEKEWLRHATTDSPHLRSDWSQSLRGHLDTPKPSDVYEIPSVRELERIAGVKKAGSRVQQTSSSGGIAF